MVTASAREDMAGQFCVAIGPITRTAGILTQSVKDTGCQQSLPSG